MMTNKGSKLATWMRKNGKVEAEVAELVGVDISHISRILNGLRRPSPELAKKIFDLTGIPILDLLFPNQRAAT